MVSLLPYCSFKSAFIQAIHSFDPRHLTPSVINTGDDHDDSNASSASYATEDEEYWGEVAASGSTLGSAGAAAHDDGHPTGQAARQPAGQPDHPEEPAGASGMRMICATCAPDRDQHACMTDMLD